MQYMYTTRYIRRILYNNRQTGGREDRHPERCQNATFSKFKNLFSLFIWLIAIFEFVFLLRSVFHTEKKKKINC